MGAQAMSWLNIVIKKLLLWYDKTVPLNAKNFVLQFFKGQKTLGSSPFKFQQYHATVLLKARNANEGWNGTKLTVMGWPKLQWVVVSHCHMPSTFLRDSGVDK
jgi:hypothetical protein